MKKRILSLLMVLVLCFSLVPAEALATETVSAAPAAQEDVRKDEPASSEDGGNGGGEGDGEKDTVIIPGGSSGGEQDDTDSDDSTGGNKDSTPGGGENGGSDDGSSLSDGSAGEGGGIYVPPGTPTEGGGGVYEPALTEIWCTNRPDSIGRAYDGTTDGNMISFYSLLFTDAESNEYTLYEGTDFTAEKAFDSADAGAHTVTVKLALISEAANKYRLRAGEEAFTINGSIDQAVPTLTVYLSKTTCTTGEELLPLLSVDGVQEDAAVTYYYTAFKTLVGASEYEGSEFVPKIDEATVVTEPGTYYIYAKTAATANYKDGISNVAELTVSNDVASVVSADGTETRYTALSYALDNAKDGDTVRLLADIGGKFDICKTITLDLNGYSWNNTATVNPNCTLTLTGSGTVNTVTLGGKLDIQDNRVKVNALNVTSAPSPAMSLNRGTFGTITITAANTTAYDLLANGYAFYDANGVMNGKGKSLTNVTVMPHTHKIEENGECACGATCVQHIWSNGVCESCGATCAHENIDDSYTCSTCGAELAASLTANGSTTYYVGLADALNAAGKSGSNTCTVTLLRSAGVTGVDGNGNIADADAAIAPGHGSSARVLDMNGHSITGGGTITAGDLGDEGHLTITGSGDIDTTIKIENGSLKLDSFSGKITTLEMGSFGSAALNSGTIGTITANDPNITAADLLAQGCVFKNADGYVSQTTSADGLTDVTVVACDHNGTDGFAIDSRSCPYCGADAVAQTALNLPESAGNPWRNFADLQTALDSNRNGGSTLRLLADVSGEYTIDGTQTTGIDLNGYSINGTVYVTGGGEETSFSNSKSAGTVETVVASAGANLAVSGAPAVIKTLKLADGATWENILFLPRNPGYKVYTDYPNMSAYTWYVPDDAGLDGKTELHNINIYRLPITSNMLTLKVDGKNYTKPSVERGTTVQLCAYCNTNGASVTFYVGERKGDEYIYARIPGVYTKIGTTWYYVAEYTFNKMGDYKVYFTASKDGYSVTSADKDLTVSKMTIPTDAITAPTAKTLTYNGAAQELVTPGIVDAKYGTMVYSLSRSASSFSTEIPTKTDAGTYRVYYKVVGSSEYKDSGSKSFRVTIAPKQLSFIDVTVADKTYDGTTAAAITGAAFGGLVGSDTLTIGTDYTAAGTFTDANAGDNKTVNATVTLTRNVRNYTLDGSDSSVTGSGTIKKATAPAATPGELYVYNGLAKTYEVELPALPELDSPKTYGVNISYNWPRSDLSESYSNGGIKFEGRKLSLPILKNSTNIEGRIGTVWMTVVTDNYEDFTLEINVFAKNRIIPVINAPSASDLTYGQTLSESTLSFAVNGAYDPTTGETVEGTLRWKDGSIVPGINADDNWYDWEFIPADSYDGRYAVATGQTFVKVNPAALTGVSVEQAGTLTYNGSAQTAKVNAAATAVNGQQVTFTYSAEKNGTYSAAVPAFTDAGIYTVYYKANSTGHTEATGSFTVTIARMEIARTTFVKNISKTYDGTAAFDLDAAEKASCLKFYDAHNLEISVPADAYELSDVLAVVKNTEGSYVGSPEAGRKSAIQYTVKLMSDNYVLHHPDFNPTDEWTCRDHSSAAVMITKAAAPAISTMLELHVTNGIEKTYELELGMLMPELTLPREYGTVAYGEPVAALDADYYDTDTAKIENGKLLLPIKAADSKAGSLGKVTVEVSSTNYETFELTIPVFSKDKLVPVQDGTVSATDITYGQTLADSTLTVTGAMKCPLTGAELTGTFAWKNPDTVPNAGDYEAEWIFTPDASYGGEYVNVTGKVTVKVSKADLTFTAPTANALTYNGNEQALLTAGTATGGTMLYRLGTTGEFIASIPTGKDAGSYTVYYKVTGDSNHNDTAEQPITVTIDPMPITGIIHVDPVSKAYDGTAEAAIDKSKVRFFNSTDLSIVLPEDAFDITNARFTKLQADKSYKESPEAGDGKALSFTLTLKSGNYVLEGKPEGTDDCTIATDDVNMFTITRAAAPTAESGALTIINGLDRTYSFDLSTLLPGLTAPCEYGTITYGAPAAELGVGTFVTRVNSRTGALTLEVVNRSSTDEGQFGTITVAVTTANYEDITLTINVSAANKTVPVPDGEVSASSITYGQTLNDSTITGKMKDPVTGEEITGTFTWKDGAAMPDAGSHDAEWIFTPDAPEYAAVTGSVTVAVDRKSIAGAVVTLEQDSFVYDGTRKDPVVSSVVLDGKTLVYGAQNDYGYSYDMAADAGTYTLMVTGNHNYCGAVTVTWSITPRTVTAPTITVSGAPFVYTGSAFTPGITVTDDLGNVIVPKEYSVSYKDNTNAGTATVTITDNDGGNYIVSGSTTFTIEKAASAITAAPAAKTGLVYNGTERELVTAGTAAGGTMKYRLGTTGEFGTAIPKAANAGEYTVYYFVEGDANHRDYEVQSLTVSIAKAAVTVTAANKSAFVGDRAPDFSKPVEGTDYTVSGLFGSDKLTGTVKLAYVDASGKEVIPNMAVTGETIIRASGVTAPNGNYTLVFADGKLTVSVRPYYTITATAGIHGSISPSGSVSVIHGGSQSFTITPNTGYAIANVRIDGVSIGAVRYYTFENVTSSHTIEAVFMRVNGNPQTGVMVDETDGSYYESAWQGE